MTRRHIKVTKHAAIASVFCGLFTGCGGVEFDLTGASGGKILPGVPGGTLPGFPVDSLDRLIQNPQQTFGALRSIQYFSQDKVEHRADLESSFAITDLSPEFTWQEASRFNLENGEQLQDNRLHYKGVPIFGVQTKQTLDGQNPTWANGFVPAWLATLQASEQISVSTFSLTDQQVVEQAAKNLNYHPWRLKNLKKFYLATFKGLRAAVQLTASADESIPGRGPWTPLRVLVDAETGEIIDQQMMSFHIDGQAVMYRENSVASAIEGKVPITLESLTGDGTKLKSDLHFYVVNCQTELPTSACSYLAAGAAGGDFSAISSDSVSYDEIVAYYALSQAIRWNRQMLASSTQSDDYAGHSWNASRATLGLTSSNNLRVYVRAKSRMSSQTTLSNAQYVPTGPDDSGLPAIIIGTGYEATGTPASETSRLRYIGRDADVAMHEFGHHMVYRSITEVTGESGAMHEGFSDFFTYAITNNNKLAESIVSTGQPLRQGTLTGPVSQYAGGQVHRVGEYWSSVLWEIRASLGQNNKGAWRADRIVWDSIDYLKSKSGFYDAIAAIAKATEIYATANSENATELKEKIYTIFYNRAFISEPKGNGELPSPTNNIVNSLTGSTASSSGNKSTTSSGGICGVVSAGEASAQSSAVATAILFILGLAIPFLSKGRSGKPKAVKVPAKKISRPHH